MYLKHYSIAMDCHISVRINKHVYVYMMNKKKRNHYRHETNFFYNMLKLNILEFLFEDL